MAVAQRRPRFFAGWTVVLAAAAAGFSEVAFFNPVLGVFIPEFEREFGWSRTEISLAVTMGTLGAAAIAPFFGSLIDRYGGKPFVVGGCALMAVGLVALANMQTEWQFFVIYGAGRALATGLISIAATVTRQQVVHSEARARRWHDYDRHPRCLRDDAGWRAADHR
jgi:MFS transporter, OFA family, oxalate/formate antiporter